MRDEIRNWLASEGLVRTLPGDDDRLRAVGMDSLAFLQLFDWILERWGVTVDESEMNPEHVGTVSLVASLVERKRGNA